MAESSSIEWTDATWNPVTGCSVTSPGCKHCYAMKLAGGRMKNHPSRAGLTIDTDAGPVWNGQVRLNTTWLDQPLGWRRPRMIFVCAHGDLFHELVPDAWIDRVFAIMALCPQHTFQVLTKRSVRMREYLSGRWQERLLPWLRRWQKRPLGSGVLLETTNGVLPHVWLGVSVEDQARADERIPDLLATPAAVRFLSCEPLLGPLDLALEREGLAYWDPRYGPSSVALQGGCRLTDPMPRLSADTKLDWVIVGGESGQSARPMHPDWARSLRDQCAAAGVPFFFKQWGEYRPTSDCEGPYMMWVGKKDAGRLLDGVEHNGMPA